MKTRRDLARQAGMGWVKLLSALCLFCLLVWWLLSLHQTIVTMVIVIALLLFAPRLLDRLANRQLIYIRGDRGERKVISALKKLPDQYYIFNDVQLQTGRHQAQIDHVLVSPYGLYCIETKSHLGKIFGTTSDKQWTQVKHAVSGRKYTSSFYNPVKQNATHCKRLHDYLQQQLNASYPIESLVVFTSADALHITSDTPVITPRELVNTLQRLHGQCQLTPEEIRRILQVLSNG